MNDSNKNGVQNSGGSPFPRGSFNNRDTKPIPSGSSNCQGHPQSWREGLYMATIAFSIVRCKQDKTINKYDNQLHPDLISEVQYFPSNKPICPHSFHVNNHSPTTHPMITAGITKKMELISLTPPSLCSQMKKMSDHLSSYKFLPLVVR